MNIHPPANQFSANGALVCWSLRDTDHHYLLKAFSQTKWDVYCPSKRTSGSALKLATASLASKMEDLVKFETTIIPRKNMGKGGAYDIFKVDPSSTTTRASAVSPIATTSKREYSSGLWTADLDLHTSRWPELDKTHLKNYLYSHFVHYSDQVSHNDIAQSFIQIITTECHGTPIRPRGGFYWVPNSYLKDWKSFLSNIDNAAGLSVHNLTVAHDDDLIKAVTSAITKEVSTKTDELIELSKSETLGEKALKSKEQAAIELKHRVTHIASELGLQTALDDLKQSCDKAKSIAAQAAIAQI